jgi:hypothetical protein
MWHRAECLGAVDRPFAMTLRSSLALSIRLDRRVLARAIATWLVLTILAVGFARVSEAAMMVLGDDLCRVGLLADPTAAPGSDESHPTPCCDFCLTAASALSPVAASPAVAAPRARLGLARRPSRLAPPRRRAGLGLGARGPPAH